MTYKEAYKMVKTASLDKKALMGPVQFLRKSKGLLPAMWKAKGLDKNWAGLRALDSFGSMLGVNQTGHKRVFQLLDRFAKGGSDVIDQAINRYKTPADRRVLGRLAAIVRGHDKGFLLQRAKQMRAYLKDEGKHIRDIYELNNMYPDLKHTPVKTRLGDVTRYFQPGNVLNTAVD